MEIREGGLGDAPAMLAMLDGAVAWLAANGRTGQWGSEPWSLDPRRVERITGIARDDEIWVAEVSGRPAGVMAVAPGPRTTSPRPRSRSCTSPSWSPIAPSPGTGWAAR
ncbi:hypothetical protein ACFQY7_15570 [Actinomadura luteofluorescens]|uniref:hypothetical protein n=1 Tax=Actinomadura luteofluorescens TaxID=46163 RepID=UPI0036380AE7